MKGLCVRMNEWVIDDGGWMELMERKCRASHSGSPTNPNNTNREPEAKVFTPICGNLFFLFLFVKYVHF